MTYARVILWGIVLLPLALIVAGIMIALPFWLIAQGVSFITTGAGLVMPDFNALVPEHVRRGVLQIWLGFAAAATIITLPKFFE